MDLFNSNPFGGQTYPSQTVSRPYSSTMPQVTTNVDLVTSLEEALYKSNIRNSDMLYLDQNKPVIYRIKVDLGGAKSYVILPYTLPDQASNAPATKADIQALAVTIDTLTSRLESLEKTRATKTQVKKKKAEEVELDESNG